MERKGLDEKSALEKGFSRLDNRTAGQSKVAPRMTWDLSNPG